MTDHLSSLIKYHNNQPTVLPTLTKLQAYKNSAHLVVAGSGPSLVMRPGLLSSSNDIAGTSSLSLLDCQIAYLFYEALPTLSGKDATLGSVDQVILDYLLFVSISNHLCSSHSIRSILLNPQYPLYPNIDIHPFINPLNTAIPSYIPSYFFIGEADNTAIVDGLRAFVHSKPTCLLNFRCSLIRALSLGYLLKYEYITLVGIDPCSPFHWYTQQSLDNCPHLSCLAPELRHLIELKRQFLHTPFNKRRMHEGDLGEKGFYSFSHSILHAIRALDSHAMRNSLPLPHISFLSTDQSLVIPLALFKLDKRVEFSCIS
jgi:hypothetical protein